jgi:hypothetical protein
LVVEHASPRMVLHELRKTLAWYSRGLCGGAELRHRCFAEPDFGALLDLGESYFASLAEREAKLGGDLGEPAVPLEDKWRARHARRQGAPAEETESCET